MLWLADLVHEPSSPAGLAATEQVDDGSSAAVPKEIKLSTIPGGTSRPCSPKLRSHFLLFPRGQASVEGSKRGGGVAHFQRGGEGGRCSG